MADYDDMTVEELREEARNRGVASSGNKADLVARLEEGDGDSGDSARGVEGEMPETGYEGGIITEGTGDFAPGTGPDQGGEVEEGIRGGAVTPNNPPAKAVLGGGRPNETEETNEFAEAVEPAPAEVEEETNEDEES